MMKRLAVALGVLAVTAAPAFADGDAEEGEKVFRKCKACHMVGDDAKNRVGPQLNGVVGNEVASVEDFKYSDAFMAKKEEGMVWTEENIAAYLENPKDFIPGTRMTFPGLKKEEDREDVIAYLKQFE